MLLPARRRDPAAAFEEGRRLLCAARQEERRIVSAHEAEDLTQGFFADLLARDSLNGLYLALGG
jgi:hypothetical protein